MRASTFQRIDIPLSRDLQTDYDKIIQLTEHLDAITAVGDMVENGVDFNELLTLTSTVEDHTTALDGKVDKVAGSSLMTDAEHTKLQFIAQQATKNQADAYLVDRANHTGTQSADTVVDGVVNVAMTAAERTRLAAMDDEANNYVHPSTHPVSILDGGVNYNKVVKTDALGNVGFGDTSWADVVGKPSTYTPNAHEHSMDEITSGTISATRVVPTETRQFVNASQLASIADMELQTNKGIPNGYVPLNANGKINASYIADLNLMDVFTPNDLNSMLNLTSAQPGDIAYRLDTGNSYMLIALPSSLEANWKQLNSGAGVVSVNGMDGIVTLGSANVPESGTNYYFTNERVDDRVVGLLQAGTNISLAYDDAANTLTVNANDVSVDWSEIQNKPDPVVTVTLQGDVTGTANATMADMGNATVTVTTTVAANSVALGTDTTGNYVADVTAGSGISVSHIQGEGSTATITNSAPNVTTNITTAHSATNVIVNSSDGTDGTINSATQTLAGVMSAADKTKLDGIEAGATGDQTASEILTLLKTVDGSGSGVDADLLDGQEGAYYLNASNINTGIINDSYLPDTITSNITGNAATATKLATARTINGVAFDGTANIVAPTNLTIGTITATSVPIESSSGTNASIPAASTTLAGVMTSADKVKLDGIAAGAQVNVATNLGITAGTTAGPIVTSSTGTSATLPTATASASGVVTTGAQTWAGVKTFSSSPIVPNATTATQAIAYGQAVKNTGDETIAGVKTFSSSPIVPVPTLVNQAISMGNIIEKTGVGIGYGTGSGGTVTQLTSKSTAVTLNRPSGQITMNSAALAAGVAVQFQLTNSSILPSETIIVCLSGGISATQNYNVWAYPINGGAYIALKNISAGSLSEAAVINFSVIKGATA